MLALLSTKIKRISKTLRVKKLDIAIYNIDEYILILIYISNIKKDDIKILYRILKKVYLINNLKVYILIKNDIVELKEIVLNINKSKAFIDSYDIIINISYY